jgi:4-amino-4-deoxy-L-arabinose transferase-like glycosyltransferase
MTRSQTQPNPAPPLLVGIVLLTICVLAGMGMGWVGYIGSDDWVYILNARDRMDAPWMIGTDHWKVRLTMTLPMALAFRAFGESELVAALPTLLYAWATGVMVLAFLWRRAGTTPALLTAVFLAWAPLLVLNATSLRIDAVENFCVIASLLCLLLALERRGSAVLLVACGLLAGLAFATRPTAVALTLFYALLFFGGYRIHRVRYLLVLAGFAAVWLAESLYYLHGTGRWFYRLGIDFRHDQVVRAGTLFDAVLVSPLRMLLSSHSFGLVFWLFPPFAWYAGRAAVTGEAPARLVRVLTLFVGTWIAVFSAFATKLVLDPRYLAPALTVALGIVAIGLNALWQRGHRALAAVIAASLLVVQALGLYVENKDFIYAERWLVKLAAQRQEIIYTDPQTRERALFLLELARVQDRIRAESPPPGALFLAVPRNAARGHYNSMRWAPSEFQPGPWPTEEILDPGPTALGRLLGALGLKSRIPESVWTKISVPNPAIRLLRRAKNGDDSQNSAGR